MKNFQDFLEIYGCSRGQDQTLTQPSLFDKALRVF